MFTSMVLRQLKHHDKPQTCVLFRAPGYEIRFNLLSWFHFYFPGSASLSSTSLKFYFPGSYQQHPGMPIGNQDRLRPLHFGSKSLGLWNLRFTDHKPHLPSGFDQAGRRREGLLKAFNRPHDDQVSTVRVVLATTGKDCGILKCKGKDDFPQESRFLLVGLIRVNAVSGISMGPWGCRESRRRNPDRCPAAPAPANAGFARRKTIRQNAG